MMEVWEEAGTLTDADQWGIEGANIERLVDRGDQLSILTYKTLFA